MKKKRSLILEHSDALRKEMTLSNLFRLTCSYGNIPAALYLEDGKEVSVTFAQYEQQTKDFAAFLIKRYGGGNKEKFAAIAMDTCPEWFPVFWGLILAGYNAVLLDFTLSEEKMSHMLTQAGAALLVCKTSRNLPKGVQQVLLDELKTAPQAPRDFKPLFADKVALCTSGTTATSRIFVYDGPAVVQQVLSSELLYKANRQVVNDGNRRSLAFLPFHHVFGFMVCLMWVSFLGYANVFLKDRSPQTIVDTATKFRIQLLLAVPLLANNLAAALEKKVAKEKRGKRIAYRMLKGTSLGLQHMAPRLGQKVARKALFRSVLNKMLGGDLECIILGGSHTPKEHMRTLNALGYFTVSGFGMTETAITSVEVSRKLRTRISGSVGRPLSNIIYSVIPDGKQDNRGEMLIKGHSMHMGQLVDGRIQPPALDKEGWFHTGDVVRLEKGSRMYVEGRVKDVIINESGENVYPDEVEDAYALLEGIEQLCVLGVPKDPKNPLYQEITLVIYLGEKAEDEVFVKGLTTRIAHTNAKLPVLKQVARVLVAREKLPLVNSIKVKRVELRRLILENGEKFKELDIRAASLSSSAAWKTGAKVELVDLEMRRIQDTVRKIYADVLDISERQIKDDAHFLDDLGGDSLQVLSTSIKVEEAFGVMIAPEEFGRCTTVNGLSRLLYEKQHGFQEQVVSSEPVTPISDFCDTPEYKAFYERQKALLAHGSANPYFVCHESALRDVSIMDGKKVLNFGSYNYVGMSGRPEVMQAAKAAIDKYGTSASGSRLLAGEKSLYQELEREIADWKHAEDALVLVGGHSTNVTIVGNFCGPKDMIVYDSLAHNSIDQGCRLSRALCKPFPHNDAAALETILRLQRSKFEKVLIIIEGAYSMDGDIADVPAFVALKKKYGCFLMVDEAHSACVIGKTGGGVDEYFGLSSNDIDIKMGTLSKGLGTCGGYLAGSTALINYLRYNLPGFVFSVGISPPLAAATLASIRLLRSEPAIMARMRENIAAFMQEARVRNLNTCLASETAVIPILVGRDEDAFLLSNKLREHGVFVPPAVFPAVPKNKARLRFCVISEHHRDQIIQALDLLVQLAAEEKIALPPARQEEKQKDEQAVATFA
jgi:8-amino-7-oxononanoate synthase/acyl carrier protein